MEIPAGLPEASREEIASYIEADWAAYLLSDRCSKLRQYHADRAGIYGPPRDFNGDHRATLTQLRAGVAVMWSASSHRPTFTITEIAKVVVAQRPEALSATVAQVVALLKTNTHIVLSE